MSLNLQTLTQALAKVSTIVEKTVQTSIQEVTGPRPLQDYDLLSLSATAGPALSWRLFSARPRPSAPSTPYPFLTLWLLDKRALSEARTKAGLSKAAEDAFLDLIRADAARLVRIRHPGVLHVVMALDENKNAMAMVTEPVFASVANAMGDVESFGGKVPKELVGMKMGLLEVKHGLLQVAETLGFLHNNAHLVHRSISPENVFITSSGAWKLGGFSFSVNIDQTTGGSPSAQPFHYAEYDVEDTALPLQPSLNYTAPELVRNKTNSVGYSCDIFSLACLAYHLIASKPLLDCHNNVKMYMNTLQYLSSDTFSAIPPELIGDLQRMLSMDENSRPSALEFTGSSFFRDDTRLRALRFLDHMLERDNMQKTAFLKALSDMWKDFDARVLRYKVLPPLCAELRNMVMQPMILPMVLTIAESQDKNDFELSTLPALVPVLSSASGETLLLLVKHAELIINKVNQDDLISHVLPLLVRAYDDSDARIQEEVLRRTMSLAKQLDTQLMKQAVLPRIHGLALKTTVAAVRVNALRCLGDLVPSLDKQSILDILQTIQRCTAVDHSPPTLMCALGVANSIFKQCGIEFAAEHVVPLIFPLLTTQQLNVQQFAKYVLFVKDILRKIEEKRGIAVTESGTTEVRSLPSSANGLHSESVQKPSVQNLTKSTSWDEDWGPTKKITNTSSDSNLLNKNSIPLSQPLPFSSPSPQPLNSTPSQPTTVAAFMPVGLEWPPSSSTGITAVQGFTEKQSSSETSNNAFDDFDPFANWPPKSTSSVGSMVSSLVTNHPGGNSASSTNSISYSSNQSLGQLKSLQGSFISNSTNANGLGLNNPSTIQMNLRNTSSVSEAPAIAMNLGYSNTNSFDTKNADLKSIFSSSNNGPAPRIAPPPATAIGRGRGRNQGNAGSQKVSRSTHSKASTEEPPILDLL